MSNMNSRKRYSGMVHSLILVILFLCPGVVISTVNAADAYYTGNLGDVIEISGVSYVGNQVYLFLTGPNLPVNGVTLSDIEPNAPIRDTLPSYL